MTDTDRTAPAAADLSPLGPGSHCGGSLSAAAPALTPMSPALWSQPSRPPTKPAARPPAWPPPDRPTRA